MTVTRFDKGSIKGKATRTDDGYIHADAIVTRTGVFLYQNPDGTIRRELRHPDDVFKQDSVDSLKMIPVTDDHPAERLVTPDNAEKLSIGLTGENARRDEDHLMSSMKITHKRGIDAVESGKKELSCGYTTDVIKEDGEYNGERYDHRQTNIFYNHLAIVKKGRAGPTARLNLDTDGNEVLSNEPQQTKGRPMKKVNLDGIEYDAAPEVANAYAREKARADSLQTKLDGVTAEVQTVKAEKSTIEAERDTLKEKAESKTDAAEIQKAVKARVELETVATKVLKADAAKTVSEMSDLDIKKAVIMEKHPTANLDGKDETYVQARFDAVSEEVATQKTVGDQRKEINERKDAAGEEIDNDKNRSDSFEALKNMHKKDK